jgi:methylated-DNA-protein-cysteine methyltransferase-like protein
MLRAPPIAWKGESFHGSAVMSSHARVYDVVRRIPRGRVATYGGVAREAGLPGRARQVGYALAALGNAAEGHNVPWHRVINARGEVSARSGGSAFERLQRTLLEAEGIVFGPGGRIDLDRYGWP